MKIILVFSLIVIIAAIALTSFRQSLRKNSTNQNEAADKPNMYDQLRRSAFSATPSKLGLDLKSDDEVYGFIMDWDVSNVTVTLVAFQTGDASMYMSSGAMIIGGIGQETTKNAAKILVTKSQQLFPATKRTTSQDVADKGCVRFYLLTSGGTYTDQTKLSDLNNGSSKWCAIYAAAHDLITEIRIACEKKKK